MTTFKKALLEYLAGSIALLIFVWGFGFVILNWLMNCQSWDEAYWTATSSCVRPGEFTMDLIHGLSALF